MIASLSLKNSIRYGEKMNLSELATALLQWEQKRRELDALEADIKVAVLALGKTQTVGNVRATYSAGRRTFDYETPIRVCMTEHPESATYVQGLIEKNTRIETITDWSRVCGDMKIDPLVENKSAPSVSLKLLEGSG